MKNCVVYCLKEYINRTNLIWENKDNGDQLVLSYVHLHNPINLQLTVRCIKLFLGLFGIDIKRFTAYIVRSAPVTKANNIGLSIKDIEKAAGWNSSSTFRKFYWAPRDDCFWKWYYKYIADWNHFHRKELEPITVTCYKRCIKFCRNNIFNGFEISKKYCFKISFEYLWNAV